MKPQDILVLLKICAMSGKRWNIGSVAKSIAMSASEVHSAIKRLEKSDLLRKEGKSPYARSPNIASVEEFLAHGVKFAFPAETGGKTRGVPTAHSAPPLSTLIVADDDDALVWPHESGTARGQGVTPLYSSVPLAVRDDPDLHALLALVDGIRIGRTRERELAVTELSRLLRPFQ